VIRCGRKASLKLTQEKGISKGAPRREAHRRHKKDWGLQGRKLKKSKKKPTSSMEKKNKSSKNGGKKKVHKVNRERRTVGQTGLLLSCRVKLGGKNEGKSVPNLK